MKTTRHLSRRINACVASVCVAMLLGVAIALPSDCDIGRSYLCSHRAAVVLILLVCIFVSCSLVIVRRQSEIQRPNCDWKKAVYNPKEFRRRPNDR